MTVVLRIAELCAREGVRVVRAPGCERAGNGQSWGHIGGIVNHHTGGGRNIFLDRILVDGHRDLPGPLTNFATLYDGDLAVVAAHPANHAGASGGWDTAPLPVSRTFNKLTLGNEIQYPGNEPMSPAQWRTILVLNRIALEELGYARRWDRIKFHNGTSITGKWDPGWAPGKTYDVRAFRRDVAAGTQEDDMANVPQDQWAAVHRAETKALDYRSHHGAPTDDQFGTVLSTRKEVTALRGEVAGLRTLIEERLPEA